MNKHTCLPEDTRPHVNCDTCGKCRKTFNKGDRVTQAFIYSHKGVNPLDLGNTGAHLFEEYELVHIDCTDPLLKKGLS